jgi:hypothetical protein
MEVEWTVMKRSETTGCLKKVSRCPQIESCPYIGQKNRQPFPGTV